MVYDIDTSLADYRGAGRAYAAIKDDRIVALRYDDPPEPEPDVLPPWVNAVSRAANALDEAYLPVAHSTKEYRDIREAALLAPDCPYSAGTKPGDILRGARAIIKAKRAEVATEYRDKVRKELELLGDSLALGQVSAFTFIVSCIKQVR